MRFLSATALLMCAATALPTLCQQTSNSDSTAAVPAVSTSAPATGHAALRSGLEQQNKLLANQVEQQRTIVKMNQELIKETQKLDEAAKRLEEEKTKVAALSAELDKRREALKADQQTGGTTANPSSNTGSTVAQNASTPQN